MIICGNDRRRGVPGQPARAAGGAAGPRRGALKTACLESLGGDVNPASRQWFVDRTPPGLRERVNTPTLLTQGTVDTSSGSARPWPTTTSCAPRACR